MMNQAVNGIMTLFVEGIQPDQVWSHYNQQEIQASQEHIYST